MKNKNDHIPAMCQEPEGTQRAEINSLPSRRKQTYEPTITLSMTGNGGSSSEVCFQHVNINMGLDHSDSWEIEATNMQMSHIWMNRQHTPSRAVRHLAQRKHGLGSHNSSPIPTYLAFLKALLKMEGQGDVNRIQSSITVRC